jgi:hypothetical protein
MNIYVLLGIINYESSYILGVYDSYGNAESAREAFIEANVEGVFDSYKIDVRELNSFPETRW